MPASKDFLIEYPRDRSVHRATKEKIKPDFLRRRRFLQAYIFTQS
jgi:hypothetical protein